MKNSCMVPLFLLALLTLSFPALAQTATNQDQDKMLVIPEGTQIQLSMSEPVSSKLSEVGDEIKAIVKKDVVVEGETVIRAGTEVIGRVTVVKPAKRPLKGGLLHLSFDRIRTGDGVERRIAAIVQSASDFERDEKVSGNSEGSLKGGKAGGDVLRNVGTAAGIGMAGAMIVILASSRDSASGGAGLGGFGRVGGGSATAAAASLGGSMIAGVLLTKGKEVRLDPGSIVRLKLERPLAIE